MESSEQQQRFRCQGRGPSSARSPDAVGRAANLNLATFRCGDATGGGQSQSSSAVATTTICRPRFYNGYRTENVRMR